MEGRSSLSCGLMEGSPSSSSWKLYRETSIPGERLGSVFFFSSTVNYHYKAQYRTTVIGITALTLNNHCPDQQRAELAVPWSSCCVHALTLRGWLAWVGHVTVSISFCSSQFVLFGNSLLALRTLICGFSSVVCFQFIHSEAKVTGFSLCFLNKADL